VATSGSNARLRRPWHPAIVDYSRMLGVGTVGFVIDFALFNVLVLVGAWPNLANAVALLTSSAVVFGANLRWTFRHRDVRLPHHSAAKFVAVQLGSIAVIAAGVAIVTGLTGSVVLWNVAKFLLTIGVGFGRFYLYREWVYTDHGRPPEA
jgi:putative flippase GtrA